MKPSAEEVAQVLDKAHDELLVRGWCRSGLKDDAGRVCAEGAITAALSHELIALMLPWYPDALPDDELQPLGKAALAALKGVLPGTSRAYIWNDSRAESIDDVLDAFRLAAKKVREEASAS